MNALERAKLLKELLANKAQLASAAGLAKAKVVAAILRLREQLGFAVKKAVSAMDNYELLSQSIVPEWMKNMPEAFNGENWGVIQHYLESIGIKVSITTAADLSVLFRSEENWMPYFKYVSDNQLKTRAQMFRLISRIGKKLGQNISKDIEEIGKELLRRENEIKKSEKQERDEASKEKDLEFLNIHKQLSEYVVNKYSKQLSRFLTPRIESAPAAIKGAVKGPEMSHAEADEHRANPLYVRGGDRRYTHNCQTCVVAYELRRRGYDVSAGAYSDGSLNEILAYATEIMWRDKSTGQPPIPKPLTKAANTKAMMKWLDDSINEGERHLLAVKWKGRKRSGHIVVALKEIGGRLEIFDPQGGVLYDTEELILGFLNEVKRPNLKKYWQTMTLIRCDNLDIDAAFAEGVLVKHDAP